MISVPIVSVPSARNCAPTTSTAQVDTAPSSSIVGKNTENSFCA